MIFPPPGCLLKLKISAKEEYRHQVDPGISLPYEGKTSPSNTHLLRSGIPSSSLLESLPFVQCEQA
jgi:hypothetical protein